MLANVQYFAPPPRLAVFSDASKTAFGRYCVQTGLYFRRSLSLDEQSRFVGSSKLTRVWRERHQHQSSRIARHGGGSAGRHRAA